MRDRTNKPVIDVSGDHSTVEKDTLEMEAKLLALNAAFEAARAGEAGDEFAVLVDLVNEWARRELRSK